MPVILIVLLVGVLAYLLWKRKTTTLTRNCRWRRSVAAQDWRCAYCGAKSDDAEAPKWCANRAKPN
ncbi:hypothetical protein GFB49_12030 [Epibacterium sp. SM1979]|uniref:Uncharacterized protein n=1 Tax=Tritonibacter litoralis TaxID=2662264 RepID=A0A843YDQ3_9RHOB|nr:hypothetical protein [Tritonibacter litoralis]MQQ09186.1 hypothetical protein [Tritonibacter litoralis]